MVLHNVVNDGVEFCFFRLIYQVGQIFPLYGFVGGDFRYIEPVDFVKFGFFRHGGTGHTGQLIVKTEEVLEHNRGQRFAFVGHFHIFFGFNSLMQAFVKATAIHQTAGKFVNDDDLAVFDHVINIALHNAVGADSLVDMVLQWSGYRHPSSFPH